LGHDDESFPFSVGFAGVSQNRKPESQAVRVIVLGPQCL
jgi:hypothetical protein